MSSRLDRVTDWGGAIKDCGYQVQGIAKHLGVSERTLLRHFQKHYGKTTKHYANQLRGKAASEELGRGELVKVVAADTHFKQRTSFWRFYKNEVGHCPEMDQQGSCPKMLPNKPGMSDSAT